MARVDSRLKIPAGLPDDVKDWDEDDVEVFLGENKKQYHVKEADIESLKRLEVQGIALLRLHETLLTSCGIPMGRACNICELVDNLRVAKGLVAPARKKHEGTPLTNLPHYNTMAKAHPRLKFPAGLPDDVKDWNMDDVKVFLGENKKEYGFDEDDIQIIRNQKCSGRHLLRYDEQALRSCGVFVGSATDIFDLVTELKIAKGLVVPVRKKREGSPLTEDVATRIKRSKVVRIAPSSLAQQRTYKNTQRDPKEKILDDRPSEDDNIPPVSLLYDGFGQFLDISAGDTNVEGFNDVKVSDLQFAVDEFAQSMCGFFEVECQRRDAGLAALDKIFAARKDGSRTKLTVGQTGLVTTGGHYTGDHGVAPMIYAFKNWSTGISAIPEVELVGHFAHSFAEGVGMYSRKLDGWRVPGLGVTIVGPDVKFYAMLSLDTQFRLVSLTPALSCIRSASEGRDRDALYRAFTAASVLQARILKDLPHHQLPIGVFNDIHLPGVSKLLRWRNTDTESDNSLEFQIKEQFVEGQRNRLLYLATIRGGQTILVKFVRQYCPELHGICALSGHAPALLAYERLPGGWYGIAMEYVADAVPVTMHDCISEHFERWKTELQELVAKFHDEGFVHGDLRDANILSGDDGCVKLVDFDWGGRDGEVLYPTPRLNLELADGRSSEDLRITKTDDLRILGNTLAKMSAQITH